MSAVVSGQIAVPTAGVHVAGPSNPAGQTFALKAHPDNAGTVWFGDEGAGSVSASTGFPLSPGEGIVVRVARLSALRFDAYASGDRICWLRLG